MTYAGDIYSWYAGSVEADVYFCPERHGTYFGSFYLKDTPVMSTGSEPADQRNSRSFRQWPSLLTKITVFIGCAPACRRSTGAC